MITDDPAHAPARGDLPFLRHRALRVPASPPSAPIDTSHHESGRSVRTRQVAAPIDTAHHDRPAVPARPIEPIDVRHRVASRPPSASLDLDDASASPPELRRRVIVPPATVRRARRVSAGERVSLYDGTTTLTLTRVQSGIDSLVVAAFGAGANRGARLGVLYELTSGETGTVETGDSRFAPSSRHPVIVAGTGGDGPDAHDQFGVDLRQIRELRRFAAYLVIDAQPADTNCTLVVTTAGGSRVDLLAPLPPGRVGVALTGYQVDGELVLRAERAAPAADVRAAAQAFGYDSITWRDGRTPLR